MAALILLLETLLKLCLLAVLLRLLLQCGFRHIDAVSFVSPQHVRQMADSEEVLELLQASPMMRGVSSTSSRQMRARQLRIRPRWLA